MALHVFGIRHHGPGSARSLDAALDAVRPSVVLLEGPPEADELIAFAADASMQPPVALLLHDAAAPGRAVFYPFAAYSPEWVALRWALAAGVPVRFMDLPVAHSMALAAAETTASRDTESDEDDETSSDDHDDESDAPEHVHADPLEALAEAAGFDGGESWWEHLVEHRRDGASVFDAVLEAMTAAREELAPGTLGREPTLPERGETLRLLRREAWMRRTIRAAEKEGHATIAAVCGAWHAPALAAPPLVKIDTELLKGLPKAKIEATWCPWTYGRLARDSGYGAGVTAPGWYDHLWTATDAVAERWMTRTAHALRGEGLDASSARIIDAVRMAEALAALRGRALAGLAELNDATQCTFLDGSVAPMALIRQRLVVGERLGTVPDGVPAVPLQRDLAATQKRLRLTPSASEEVIDLDLRKDLHLDRSRLWHRLNLLDVRWAATERASGTGTFRERWRVCWRPELAVAVIEASAFGNTVEDAAAACVAERARSASLAVLCRLVDDVLLADLPGATSTLVARLDALSAAAADLGELMAALPRLAHLVRYGNVRTAAVADGAPPELAPLRRVVDGMVTRIAVGLPVACHSLDDDAAATMFEHVVGVDRAVTLLDDADHRAAWRAAVAAVLARDAVHGLVRGRAARLLFDAGALDGDAVAQILARELSPGASTEAAAAWVDGLLRDSGDVLVHHAALRDVIDAWVLRLDPESFENVLPLVRRTFSTFPGATRRAIGRAVKSSTRASSSGAAPASGPVTTPGAASRADAVLPFLARVLGLEATP